MLVACPSEMSEGTSSAVSDKRSEGDEIAIAKQSIKMRDNELK
jgi:hypothetical protein